MDILHPDHREVGVIIDKILFQLIAMSFFSST